MPFQIKKDVPYTPFPLAQNPNYPASSQITILLHSDSVV